MATWPRSDQVSDAYLAWRGVRPLDGTLAAAYFGVVDALFLRLVERPECVPLTLECLQNALVDCVRTLQQDGEGECLAEAALAVLHARLWSLDRWAAHLVINVILSVSFQLHNQAEHLLRLAPLARLRTDIRIKDIIVSWSPEGL